MPTDKEYADKILTWLRRNRHEIIDLSGLGASIAIVGSFVTPIPLLAAAASLTAAAVVPLRRPKGTQTRSQAFLMGLPRSVLLFGAISIAWLYVWSLPPNCLLLGPIWMAIWWVTSLNWRPLLSGVPGAIAQAVSVALVSVYLWLRSTGGLWLVPIGIGLALLAWSKRRPFISSIRWGAAWAAGHRSPRAESAMRIFLLAVMSLWLMRGFNSANLQGSGDSGWYGAVLADTMAQTRAGVFPIWAGQSAYQFNGAISPLRIAPAFCYAGAFLDEVTFRSLGPAALMNLMLTVVAIVATFSCYLCLGALLPAWRWLAAGLTALFMACPGVLAVVYGGDLYMSWMTLPLIPPVFLGTILSFRPGQERRALLLLGACLGLCWWAHAPIALWATTLAACAQLARLAALRGKGLHLGALIPATMVFGALAAYPIGSVLLYPTEPGKHMSEVQVATPGSILYFLQDAYPGIFRPLSDFGRLPGDMQFGYSLWALLIFCLYYRFRGASLEVRILLIEAAFLAILVLPIPGINPFVWGIVPAFIRNPTGNWVAARLYLLMAAATVFAVAALFRRSPDDRSPKQGILLAILIVCGCGWSLREASKFAGESRLIARDAVAVIDKLRSENLQLTRYSYGMFPRFPSTFTHGVTDPVLENHLISRETSAPILENADAALAASHLVASASFVRKFNGSVPYGELDRPLRIQPERSYLLQPLIERPEDAAGVLQITGSAFFREYGLPEHGGPRAFGVGGEHLGVIPIWTTTGAPEDLAVRIFPTARQTVGQSEPFSSGVRLLSYDQGALPIRVDSWIPYTARVRSPAPALLETPRMHQSGYTALVNGAPAQVSKSPDGFVCVAVPEGESRVILNYSPPAGLRLLFCLSFLTFIGVGTAAVVIGLSRGAAWANSAKTPAPAA